MQILQRLGIRVDVDEAADLKCILERLHLYPAGETAQLLYHTALGARVSLALATLPGDLNFSDDMNRGTAS